MFSKDSALNAAQNAMTKQNSAQSAATNSAVLTKKPAIWLVEMQSNA
jgi:hypothetical protein